MNFVYNITKSTFLVHKFNNHQGYIFINFVIGNIICVNNIIFPNTIFKAFLKTGKEISLKNHPDALLIL